jgi:two-component system sensor histidine kinase BaeS
MPGRPDQASRLLGPLGVRLALAFLAVALAAIAVLGVLTLAASRREVADVADRQRDQDAAEIAETLARAYQDAGGWSGADVTGAFALAAAAQADLVVVDPDGDVVATRPRSIADHMGPGRGDGQHGPPDLGEARRMPVDVGGTTVGVAQVRFPASRLAEPDREILDALARVVLAGAGLAALVALAAAVFVSRRISRPLVSLTATARQLEAGDRDARAGAALTGAPGELGELARAFDQMADALHRHDELRRGLVADVAHELRTPTTILRASCEELVDGLADPTPQRLSSLHDETLRLARVVEDLEALAHAEAAGLHLERAPVDLATVATTAVEALRPRFVDAGRTLTTRTTPAPVDGDAGRLHQVTVNLLTNALKYTPPGGEVTVTVGVDGERALLAVSDTGPGIAPEDQPHVFERFWHGRGDAGRAGSGIGLAIVSELVGAHGGRVVLDSTPGEGSTFTVELPVL